VAKRTLILKGDGVPDWANPDASDIDHYLSKLHPVKHSFVILEDNKGGFVQCAGAKLILVLDFHTVARGKHRQFVLRKDAVLEDAKSMVNCKCGPVQVHRNERLDLKDAREVFLAFLTTRNVPKSFFRREITQEFEWN